MIWVIIAAALGITVTVLVLSLRTDEVDETLNTDPILKTLFILEDKGTVLAASVLLYYPPLNRGVVFDVPGNIGSIFTSLGRVDRIDAIFRDKGSGPYTREIEALFGQGIPFTVVITLDNFCRLADYLGGFKIFIPSPIDIENENGARSLLPSGSVNLDGDKVRTFITYHSPEESAAEVQSRREKVIIAFLEALNARDEYFDLSQAARTLQSLMSSRLKGRDFRHLLRVISQVDVEQLHPQSVGGTIQVVDGQTLLFPERDGQLIRDVTLQTIANLVSRQDAQYNRTYVLEILNNTAIPGLARNAASLFQMVGYSVFRTANADSGGPERTTIIDHIGNAEAAKSLGDFIRCEVIVEEEVRGETEASENEEAYVDFTIILGRDFDGRYVRAR
jgi:anionic cell wall polymer biosynthesis LytR-Cps2A-Psr (LCP) family protein